VGVVAVFILGLVAEELAATWFYQPVTARCKLEAVCAFVVGMGRLTEVRCIWRLVVQLRVLAVMQIV
jgi:hypothetical protein